jgi:thiamine pyrophosphate-dependent acetolactate synthase large subunit-like protein
MQKDIFGAELNVDLCNPDFAALAGAYGIPYQRATTPGDLVAILKSAFATRGPAVIEVPVRRDARPVASQAAAAAALREGAPAGAAESSGGTDGEASGRQVTDRARSF